MNIKDLVLNVAILFIMMIPGVIMRRGKLASDSFGKGISNLVLYIAQPCLIVYAYLSTEASFNEIWVGCLATLLLSFLSHSIFALAAFLSFKKAPDSARRMLRFTTIFANAAFMGIPLIEAVIPDPTAVIYASIYNITFNLFIWTLGVKICTGGTNDDSAAEGACSPCASLRRVIIHPVTLAAAIGLLLLILGINQSTLESANLYIISDSLLMLKNLVSPLSMVVIGLRLADIDLRGTFKDAYMYLFLALRHLVLPMATVLVVRLLSLILPISETVAFVIAITASAPAATSSTMFAEKYDCDAGYVSRLVAVSTILCIVTMPLIVLFAKALY